MLDPVLQSLQQFGFAVIPQLADAALLDAMRCESTALLENAELAHTNEHDAAQVSVSERM